MFMDTWVVVATANLTSVVYGTFKNYDEASKWVELRQKQTKATAFVIVPFYPDAQKIVDPLYETHRKAMNGLE